MPSFPPFLKLFILRLPTKTPKEKVGVVTINPTLLPLMCAAMEYCCAVPDF
jgi:hypothetical protein